MDTGQRLADEARVIVGDFEAREQTGKILMAQAFALQRKGDLAAARPLWEASLMISREFGDQHLAITQLIALAICVFHEGDRREAQRIALEAVEEAADAQNVQLAVWMLDLFAAFVAPAAPGPAVRLAGAVDALREAAGGGKQLEPLDIEDARIAAARELSSETLEHAWAEGRTMNLEQAVEYAKEVWSSVK